MEHTHDQKCYAKCMAEVLKPQNKYKKDLLQALAYLEKIAEEAGLYGEDKRLVENSVESIKNFINNRI